MTETARLHDEILSLRAELAQTRDLLRAETQRANAAIERGTTAEEAALEAEAPSVDRAALRDRITTAISKWHRDPEQPLYEQGADAVLAVLPAPADRAAVLLWAADRIDAGWFTTAASATAELRRLAAEAQPATPDTADREERPEDTARRLARRLYAIERLCSGRPGYHQLTVKQVLTAMDPDDTEAQPAAPDTETPTLTEARAAFMQIGRTPSLEGLRAELRIEGQEPLVGRYCGASMSRLHDVPGHEHLLAVDPRLIFEYADQAAEPATPETEA